MKKGLIIFVLLLVVTLSGCKKEKEKEIDFFAVNETDIEVCSDCEGTAMDFQLQKIVYDEHILSTGIVSEIDYESDFNFFHRGVVTDKEDLERQHPLSRSIEIQIDAPYSFLRQYWGYMRTFISNCENQEVCTEYDMFVGANERLSNVSYGFDDTSGHYSFDVVDENDTLVRREYLKYDLQETHFNYEFLLYYPEHNQVKYTYMVDGEMHDYHIVDEKLTSLGYVNLHTGKTVYIQFDDRMGFFTYYDPTDEIAYTYNSSLNEYWLQYHDNYEMVVSYSEIDTQKNLGIDFYFMNGWDQVYQEDGDISQYVELYNNDARVFEEYDVYIINSPRYVELFAPIKVENPETFELPEELDFDGDFDDIYKEFSAFKSLDDPLSMIGLDSDKIEEKTTELYNKISDE